MAMNGAPADLVCQSCGATPAKKVVFQSIAGMLIMHQIRTAKGVFCRDCGLRVKEEMDTYTLKRGWFSIGGLIGIPIYLGINAMRASKLKKLPAPVRAQAQQWQGQTPPMQGQPQPWQGQGYGHPQQGQGYGQPQPWQGQAQPMQPQPQPQPWQGQGYGQPQPQPQPWQGQGQGQPQSWQQ
jgi:hypothetical protein